VVGGAGVGCWVLVRRAISPSPHRFVPPSLPPRPRPSTRTLYPPCEQLLTAAVGGAGLGSRHHPVSPLGITVIVVVSPPPPPPPPHRHCPCLVPSPPVLSPPYSHTPYSPYEQSLTVVVGCWLLAASSLCCSSSLSDCPPSVVIVRSSSPHGHRRIVPLPLRSPFPAIISSPCSCLPPLLVVSPPSRLPLPSSSTLHLQSTLRAVAHRHGGRCCAGVGVGRMVACTHDPPHEQLLVGVGWVLSCHRWLSSPGEGSGGSSA
jgi:hypothetical protein